MKCLVIGLGSMGKRRIRNLFANGEKDVIGFDISEDRRKEAEDRYGIQTISDLATLQPGDVDAFIISTPPFLHAQYIRLALEKNVHFFVETMTSEEAIDDVFHKIDDRIRVPSCTFRFFSPIKMIKQMLDEQKIGTVLAYQYHLGQYLPDWHPWEDYRKVFFSRKDTGACRELFPFELCWLNWVVGGTVKHVVGHIAHVSTLDMEADDVLSASVVHENNVRGNILIDVVSRKPYRTLQLMGSEGVIEWDWIASEIRVYSAATKQTETIVIEKGKVEEGYIIVEEMYVEEIKAFLEAVRGTTPYPYTFQDIQHNLRTLVALENGSAQI